MEGDLEFLSAVIVVSSDAERLARFYREVLGVPLQPAQHGESHRHYECLLGDVHFAIHPQENQSHAHPSSTRIPRADPRMTTGASEARSPLSNSRLAGANSHLIPVGSVKLALTTFDIAATVKRLQAHSIEPIYPPKDIGFATMTAIRDPDGNYVEITELGERWYRQLEERRSKGHDVVHRWRTSRH